MFNVNIWKTSKKTQILFSFLETNIDNWEELSYILAKAKHSSKLRDEQTNPVKGCDNWIHDRRCWSMHLVNRVIIESRILSHKGAIC